jgi:Fe(3+) dicitrate transport protein
MKDFLQLLTAGILTALSIGSFAQTGSLKGTVKDSSGTPVESATVMLQNTKIISATNGKGNYQLTGIPAGEHTVVVSVVGYKSVSDKVTIKENETGELNFKLNQKINQLKEVSIIGTMSINGMGHLNEVHDGIIYSGKKTEVLVLDSMDANTAQNNPREVLGRIPGANYSETEGGGFPANGIAFRGLRPTQSQEVQTRQNGYNIAADLYGYPESYYLPPLESVDRVEVIRGASSLQFGPQFGGCINFIMKDGPKDKPLEVSTQQTLGNYGFTNSFNSIGGTYKKWNYYSYVQFKSAQGWRPNSDYRQVSGFAKVEYAPSDKFKLGLEYTLFRNTIHMPGGLTDSMFKKDNQQSFRARNWLTSPWNILAFTFKYQLSENTALTFKSALNISNRDLVWKNEDGGPALPDDISPITNTYSIREVQREAFLNSTNELRLLTNYNIKGQNQTLALGVRYFTGSMRRQGGGPGSVGSDFDLNLYGGNYEYALDFTTMNVAPFFENTFHIGNRLSVTPGFRFEYIRSTSLGYVTDESSAIVNSNLAQHWNLPLAGIGIQLKTSKSTNIYTNISETYEPTPYSNLTPIGVASLIDPHMKDVSGYNADIGWRGKIKQFLDFDISLFYMQFNDEIGLELQYNLVNNDTVFYTYRTNVGNSVHKGLETYAELHPLKTVVGNISFFNSYSYIDARYVAGEFKGNHEEMAPVNIDRLGINYAFHAFSTTFLISNVSKSYSTADNAEVSAEAIAGAIPSYRIMDWSSKIKIKNYNIKLGISNLTNTKYFNLRTDEYPGPGIIPAMGRSMYIGFGAKF